jgi:hypothetical protein
MSAADSSDAPCIHGKVDGASCDDCKRLFVIRDHATRVDNPTVGPAIEWNKNDPAGESIGWCSGCGLELDEPHSWQECVTYLSDSYRQAADAADDFKRLLDAKRTDYPKAAALRITRAEAKVEKLTKALASALTLADRFVPEKGKARNHLADLDAIYTEVAAEGKS